jgi:hypothetical protein
MTVSSSRPAHGSRGGLLLKPLAAAVNLSFALPQSSTYISVLLTPRVRLVQLLANIVGLTSVLGAFGVLFGLTEDAHKWCSKKLSRGRGKASAPAASATGCAPPAGAAAADAAAETATPTGSFKMENPMRRRGGDGSGNGSAPIAPLHAAARFDELPPPALMFPSPAAAAASVLSAAARGRGGDGDAASARPQVALSSPLAGRAAPLRSGFAPTAAASARAAPAAAVVAIPVAEAPPPAAATAEKARTEAEAGEKAAAAARGGAAEEKSALQTLAERAFSLNELPPGWDFEIASEGTDNSGGLYFILPSGETSWDDPRADWKGYWRAVRAAADEGADLGAWEHDFPVEEESTV